MISTQEAKKLVLAYAGKVTKPVHSVKLSELTGRVLASDLKALCDSPPFEQSAMDGYALNSGDIKKGIDIFFSDSDENSAGRSGVRNMREGKSVRIFTGARLPKGADVVVPQEFVSVADGKLVFDRERFAQGDNIRPKGSQFKKQDVLLCKGTSMNAACIALAASAGHPSLKVFGMPKVTVIVTGSELIAPGKKAGKDKIYESNSVMLQSLLFEAGIRNVKIRTVKDELKQTVSVVKKAFGESDLVLISGGISVGKYDLIKDVLAKLNTETVFHKVKQKPGKPVYFGRKGKKHVFGLPGNPAASITCFYEYVLPFIRTVTGHEEPLGELMTASLMNSYSKKAGLTHYLKGKYEGGKLKVLPDQESYKITGFASANCIIVVPEESEVMASGSEASFHMI